MEREDHEEPNPIWGVKYRRHYIYSCPTCQREVIHRPGVRDDEVLYEGIGQR